MIRSSGRLWLARLAVAVLLGLFAATAGSSVARAAAGCGIVTASGHSWIVVAKGVPCTNAKQVVRGFAARTAALRNGASIVVPSPLRGFHCLLASRGKPGGSCTTAGAAKSILWLGA